MSVDLNSRVCSPARRTSEWGFVLYLTDGSAVPVGVYGCYADGAAHANAAMRHYGDRADRWEGQPLYLEETGDGDDSEKVPGRE